MVELLESAVPIPITVKIDAVKVVRRDVRDEVFFTKLIRQCCFFGVMLFSFAELIDLVIMAVAVGFIFSKFFPRREVHQVGCEAYDPLRCYAKSGFWGDLKYGIIIAVPSVVLHELAHKFTAVGFGVQAVLSAPVFLYLIAIALIFAKFPVVFLVGGYVSIIGSLTPWQSALVSVSGPFVNLLIWGVALFMSRNHFYRKYAREIVLIGRLNMFLFVFNLLPIPGFDGFGFFSGLIKSVV